MPLGTGTNGCTWLNSPQAECPVCMSLRLCRKPVVLLCAQLRSAQTISHICTYLVPINYTIIVDVQHTFHFDLDFTSDPGENTSFSARHLSMTDDTYRLLNE